jgi:hypothetical protein
MLRFTKLGRRFVALYEIRLDKPQRFVHIVLEGFWQDATMSSYEHEVRENYLELRKLGGNSKLLVDRRNFPVQTPEYARRLEELVVKLEPIAPDRIAVIVPNGLAKLQVERATAAVRDQRRIFLSEEEAKAWLFEG